MRSIFGVKSASLAGRVIIARLPAAMLAVAFSLATTGCVVMTKHSYREQIGLAAVVAYDAGLNDCGSDKIGTAQNVLKRLEKLLDGDK